MAKLSMNWGILILFSLLIATEINARKGFEEEEELRLDYLCLKSERLAKIVVYAEDVGSGPNATLYEVARASVSADALLAFGKMYVIEVAVTAAPPGADAPVVLGAAQGMMSSADKETSAMAMNVNFFFTAGKYNGSSISIAGRNTVMDRSRPVAVVGGTGVFRFTRGHAVVTTISSRVGADSIVYTVLEYAIYATFCPSISS